MSLCRYLPVPSDRMGIIWSLLSVKDSIILEYGPAGTTHFSMGFYGTLGVDWAAEAVYNTYERRRCGHGRCYSFGRSYCRIG